MKIELVAAYVRVSTQEQKLHGLSLDAQKARLTEYAEKNNMKIVEWYVDEGVSGRKLIRNRPELQRMIQDAEQKKFDRIIFIKLDRFFRSVAEYHECMKRIAPVVWTTTEEEYDLTTANGRMLVNMKLTIAEMEADQTGERINLVNDYKTSTGQPLTGSMPFGYMIVTDANTGRKKIVRDPDKEEILRDVINFYLMHQSVRKTLVYMRTVHGVSLRYQAISGLLKNTMLYGAYRDNPSYCEAYIDKETFGKLQDIHSRNVKVNTAENRAYYFTGLIKCPVCGKVMKGNSFYQTKSNGTVYIYKIYRCAYNKTHAKCSYNKILYENTVEKLMLENIEDYLAEEKVKSAKIANKNVVKRQQESIADIHDQIDRLNYSWQTGKIRKVEQYEKDYAALMDRLAKVESEQLEVPVKDFSKIESMLTSGWKEIYKNLDDEHKRSFWRSFVKSIEVDWSGKKKALSKVNFF